MRRGSTATLHLSVTSDMDLTQMKNVRVIFRQAGMKLQKNKDDSGVTVSKSEVAVTLTQEETLKFYSCVPAYVQIKAITERGEAVQAEPEMIDVEETYDESVME